MSISRLARDEIRGLKPYEAAIQVDDTIRLNANESPWRNSTDTFSRPLNRYPEIRPARLAGLLAKRYGCEPSELLVTRGASEAIDLLMRVFCTPGLDNIVTAVPTFSMYEHYAIVQGVEFREVPTDRDRFFDMVPADLLSACDERSKLVFLCSPNNPTGRAIPRDDLVQILNGRSGMSVVVVDEAYVEFSDTDSATELLDQFDNLVVLRTLSKALGLAGARCGAAIADKAVIDMLNAVQAPYALATPVVECVEKALQSDALADSEQRVSETVHERARLSESLQALPFVRRVWPSDANFILVEVEDASTMMRHCRDDNLLLRYFGGRLSDCVRISVGSVDENDALLASLSRMETNNA